MATREIIEIDEDRCDGCGACAGGCHEGALRIIDGKARLVGESLCDGLGACIGECPRGAIRVVRREAEDYDEAERGAEAGCEGGCPGSASRRFAPLSGTGPRAAEGRAAPAAQAPEAPSALGHWPVQLHLINPGAPQFAGADLLVAADCTAFALGSFHPRLLAGRSLVIACPKLDQGREIYLEKLAALVGAARSVSVAIMEVPCCSGLLKIVLEAREAAGAAKPVETFVIGVEGAVVSRESR